MSEYKPSDSLIRHGFSRKVVPPTNAVVGQPLVLAEAPGRKEDEEGITLHPEADAGGLFTRLLQRVGVSRDSLTLANTVWQRPPKNELYDDNGYPMTYTHEAVAYWKPFLHRFIEEMKPPVVIGLGRTALEVLTGFTDIGTTRGYVHQARIEIERAKDCPACGIAGEPDCFECGGSGVVDDWVKRDLHVPAICTYHPQFLNYGQKHLSGVFLRDILAALEIGRDGWKPPKLNTTPVPTVEQFRRFCEDYQSTKHFLTYDIETPEKRLLTEEEWLEGKSQRDIPQRIDRMSFCYDTVVGGWSIPWEEPFISMARKLLASDGPKRGWNIRLFDRPRLMHYDCPVRGREYDLLDQWRHLHRTLPASLAFVAPFYLAIEPWKYLNHAQPEQYSALDSLIEHLVAEGMERDLRASGQWEMYERHVVDILKLTGTMADNGLPYSQEKAQEFERELEGKLAERQLRLQALTPVAVRKTKTYKGLNPQLRQWFKENGTQPKLWVEHDWADLKRLFSTRYQEPQDGEWYTYALTVDNLWQKVYDFNPNSHLQKKALIKHFQHKCKTNRKSKKETSDDNTLKSLITAYIESKKPEDAVAVECYQLIRECVAISKVLGTYVRGWRPGKDGLIHATPGIWGDMFRISWRDPNLAATVADKKEVQIASGFRKCIACSNDDVLIESDWRSQEAVILAYYANDPDYMRLAKMSLNAYMASHLLNRPADLSWSDSDLKAYLKEIRDDPNNNKIYDDAKHAIYLVQNGGTFYLLSEMYELPKARAKYLIEFYYALFPRIKAFQQKTLHDGHVNGKLVNAWGYRMPTWDVYTWKQTRYDKLRKLWVESETGKKLVSKVDREWVDRIRKSVNGSGDAEAVIRSMSYDLGTEAKAALSFFPRDTGAAMLKDSILGLEDQYQQVTKGYLRASAHDSLISIAPYCKAEEVAEQMREVQESPIPQLEGLVVEVEQKFGRNWDKKAMRSSLKYLPQAEAVGVA